MSQSRIQDAFCVCTRATRLGRVACARDAFSVFPGCGGSMPTMWHASLACGTCPQHVGCVLHAQNVSWMCDWDMHCPRCVAHAWDSFCVFPGCGGSMPTIRHASPACGTCPRHVRCILDAQ